MSVVTEDYHVQLGMLNVDQVHLEFEAEFKQAKYNSPILNLARTLGLILPVLAMPSKVGSLALLQCKDLP